MVARPRPSACLRGFSIPSIDVYLVTLAVAQEEFFRLTSASSTCYALNVLLKKHSISIVESTQKE
jgi:hypothetical protein